MCILISLRDSRRGNSRLRGTEASRPRGFEAFQTYEKNAGNSNIHPKGFGWDYARFEWLIWLWHHFGVSLGYVRRYFGHQRVVLERFGTTLWIQLWRMRLTVDHCGVNLGTLGRVGVALTSLWGQFAHLGVGLGSLWADFWIIWGSLCSCLAYEGPFSKTLVSLCFFTILMALVWTRSHFGGMLGGFGWLWGHFWDMRLSLGNFEIT